MARYKSKFSKVNVKLTPYDVLYRACRLDVDNMTAFFQTCMVNHLKKSCKDLKFLSRLKDQLSEEDFVDLVYIMRSCCFKKHNYFPWMDKPIKDMSYDELVNFIFDDESLKVSNQIVHEDLSDEELDELLEGL